MRNIFIEMTIGKLRKMSDNQLNNIDFYNHITEDGLNAMIEELDRIMLFTLLILIMTTMFCLRNVSNQSIIQIMIMNTPNTKNLPIVTVRNIWYFILIIILLAFGIMENMYLKYAAI